MSLVNVLRMVVVSVFLFWSVYNLPAFFAGLKRYMEVERSRGVEGPDPPEGRVPKVSIIVPVKNEEKVVGRLLEALVRLDYPEKEVIVVEDGSSDRTGEICRRYAEKYPNLIKFYHKEPSRGKPQAINYAARRATGDIIAVYDADTVVAPDILWWVVPHFRDPEVGMVQGGLYVVNPDENSVTRLSVLNEFMAHIQLLGRDKLGLFVPSRGTHTYVRRRVLEELDYWDPRALAEDLDLSVRLVKRGYRIKYVPVKAGVEAPSKLRVFLRQQFRWFRGHVQAALKHLGLPRPLDMRGLDAQLTLVWPLILPLTLLGYLLAVYCAVNPAVASPFERMVGMLLLALSASAPVALAATNPRNCVNLPLLFLSWNLTALISTAAVFHALLRRPAEWTRTEKTGAVTCPVG